MGQPAFVAEDDHAALPGRAGEGHVPEVIDDDGTTRPGRLRRVLGFKTGPVDGVAADPQFPRRQRTAGAIESRLPVETTRNTAFAYVFAGSGKFCNASGPLAVPTEGVGWADTSLAEEVDNRSLVLFDRGDEVTVQAGEQGSASC